MSTKIYDAYIVRNVDYKDFFNKINLLKDELIISISDLYLESTIRILKNMKLNYEKKGYIPFEYFPNYNFKTSREYKFNKDKTNKFNILMLLNDYSNKPLSKFQEDELYYFLKFNICFFPNGDDILILKHYTNKVFDEIVNKYFKLEDYSYYDNYDAPYESYSFDSEYYVSKEDWEKRKLDWENVLTEKNISIPSLNSIQLNLDYNLFCNPLIFAQKIDIELRKFEIEFENENDFEDGLKEIKK